jgi:prepilin-type processing-associated H-X9-DG protein
MRHIHQTHRPGISRAEVVIVLAILALLGGLIVTGIGRLREAAAAAQCKNNLKQLALGVHNYDGTMNRLPPLVDQGEKSPTGRGLPSVFATLRPYLEKSYWRYWPGSPPENYHAHSSTDFEFKIDGTSRVQTGGDANQTYSIFRCPSDTTADRLRDVPVTLPDGSRGHYATGSYAANGLLPWNVGKLPVGIPGPILFAERPQVCRTAAGETVHNLWGVGFYDPQMPAFAALAPAGLGSTGQVAPMLPLPSEREAVRVQVGTRDALPTEPDFATPLQRIVAGRPCDPRLPGSPHRGGMNAAMADGSVRTFAWDTPAWVWWAACVPADERR